MDAGQFDALTARMSGHLTRRRSLGLLGILGVTTTSVVHDADAKKRKKKKKKKCKGGTKKCGKACIAANACCSNADCGFQGACESGVCDCKSGARICQGTCIPEGQCCSNQDCANVIGQSCVNGQC